MQKEICVTREQFARWSFKRDLGEGCFADDGDDIREWGDLSEDEQKVYLDEADVYLRMSVADWPIDILARL